MSIKSYNPINPSDRSKFSRLYKFNSKKELAKYDLPFSVTRIPNTKIE